MISFTVPGKPATKGSVRAIVAGRTRAGRPKAIAVADCERLKPWADAVGWAARAAMAGHYIMTRPVEIGARFRFARPKTTKLAVPAPDLDKLLRAAFDAMTGIVYEDDKQAERVDAHKRWCEPGEEPGVDIVVKERSATPILDMARAAVTDRPDVLAALARNAKPRRGR